MYQYKRDPQTGETKIVSRDYERVKKTLLYRLTNMGQPFMYVVDGNYRNRGELYLAHQFSGLEVDLAKAKEVLRNLRTIWGRPVHMQARIDDDQFLFSCDEPGAGGEPLKKDKITSSTPPPAHMLE
jgi:stage V sporulation protein R